MPIIAGLLAVFWVLLLVDLIIGSLGRLIDGVLDYDRPHWIDELAEVIDRGRYG